MFYLLSKGLADVVIVVRHSGRRDFLTQAYGMIRGSPTRNTQNSDCRKNENNGNETCNYKKKDQF